MPEKVDSKERQAWKMIETFMTTIMGMLVGTTPLIIAQSSFTLEVALILFFLNNGIVIDDWWMTVKATSRYNLRTGRTITVTIIYYHFLIMLTIWLIAAGKDLVPLEGYLMILFAISLLDLVWCQSVCRANPSLHENDYLIMQAWKIGDVVGAIVYLFGFVFLFLMKLQPLITALIFVGLYIMRRILDEGISKILFRVTRARK